MKIPTDLWNWVVHLIKENRPVWLANGVEIGPADRINISATVTRDGNTLSISGMGAGAHAVVSASHTATGLETNPCDVLQALTPSTFGWGPIADAMIPSTIARDAEVATAITDHEAAENPHTQYLQEVTGFLPLSLFDAAGDLVVATAADIAGRLAKGTDDQVLSMVSGNVAWAKPKFVTYLVFGTEDQTYTV